MTNPELIRPIIETPLVPEAEIKFNFAAIKDYIRLEQSLRSPDTIGETAQRIKDTIGFIVQTVRKCFSVKLPVVTVDILDPVAKEEALHQEFVKYDPTTNGLFRQVEQIRDEEGHLLMPDKRWKSLKIPLADDQDWLTYGEKTVSALEQATITAIAEKNRKNEKS